MASADFVMETADSGAAETASTGRATSTRDATAVMAGVAKATATAVMVMDTKDLALPKPQLALDAKADADGSFAVTVRTNALARAVRLDAGALDGAFDDNYFDLLPGDAPTVTFRPHAPTTLAAVKAALHATSIADTY